MVALRWTGVLLGGYALGCFNTAYYLVRWWKGADLREVGSGNAGARNAGRILGSKGFAAALAGDALKGAVAALAAHALGLGTGGEMAALLAAVAGHVWPIQLGWRGGKGAATAFGGLVALHPLLALEVLGTALIGGLVAMFAAPGLAWCMGLDAATVAGLGGLALLLVWTHRSHVGRIIVRLRV